jgi:uncharacterized protein YjiS (DUF1127 family)
MSTLNTNPPVVPLGALTIYRFVRAAEDAIARLGAWNRRRRAALQLAKLNPAQRRDLGLEGIDLDALARGLRPRRR